MTFMFTFLPYLFGAGAVYEGARRIICEKFSGNLAQYCGPNPQVGFEILVTHLAHASTLTTKAQFCTWFLTFVSSAYKGEAASTLIHLITELQNMPEAPGVTEAEVQAGDCERDIAAECRAFMSAYPKGSFVLPVGADMDVQAAWDDVRMQFGTGVDCFRAVRHAPFLQTRAQDSGCLYGGIIPVGQTR